MSFILEYPGGKTEKHNDLQSAIATARQHIEKTNANDLAIYQKVRVVRSETRIVVEEPKPETVRIGGGCAADIVGNGGAGGAGTFAGCGGGGSGKVPDGHGAAVVATL